MSRRRRVLIIVENLPVPFDRRVMEEARALTRAGYHVSVICPKARGFNKSREAIEGIDVYRHSLPLEASGARGFILEYGWAFVCQFTLAWRVFLARGFDVVHACNPPDNIFFIAAVFKYLFGRKFVFDHHDLCPELYEAKFSRRDRLYRLMLTLERWTFAVADISIATNDSYRQVAIRRGGMDPQKVFVVRSGPNLNRVYRVAENPALRRGRRYLVGYVGVMGQQEGLQYLLQAVRHIVRDRGRDDVQFGLVGDGPDLPRLRNLAHDLGIEDYVTFTGSVPDGDLLELLSTADVCVNPDEHNEMNDKSTMNKVMEYMALEKPIVQFDLTEGRVSAAEAAIYARPNDADDLGDKVLLLLDDPERRAEMGRLGRTRVERLLSWEHQVPILLGAYDSLWTGVANTGPVTSAS